jgi:hypothetical protein
VSSTERAENHVGDLNLTVWCGAKTKKVWTVGFWKSYGKFEVCVPVTLNGLLVQCFFGSKIPFGQMMFGHKGNVYLCELKTELSSFYSIFEFICGRWIESCVNVEICPWGTIIKTLLFTFCSLKNLILLKKTEKTDFYIIGPMWMIFIHLNDYRPKWMVYFVRGQTNFQKFMCRRWYIHLKQTIYHLYRPIIIHSGWLLYPVAEYHL